MSDAITVKNMTLTVAGLGLISKCMASGKSLHFSRMAIGDGVLPDDADIVYVKDMTSMISPKLDVPIIRSKALSAGAVLIEGRLQNTGLSEGFHAREDGIFAIDPDTLTDPDDPMSGQEVLYAYRNTGNYSEYIFADGEGTKIDYLHDLVIAIDQVENVTINIEGELGSVGREEFYAHEDSDDPHPNAPGGYGGDIGGSNSGSSGSGSGDGSGSGSSSGGSSSGSSVVDTSSVTHIWVAKGDDKKIYRAPMNAMRDEILGGTEATIPLLAGRISQLEIELGNVGLQAMVEGELQESNLYLYENFEGARKIDQFSTRVNAATAGSNTIGLVTLDGIVRGSYYWITDGVRQELIQVDSMARNGDVYRILTKEPIVNTYYLPQTMLYRTTADITNSIAYGSSDRKGILWAPQTVWQGESGLSASTVKLDTSLTAADNYQMSGDITFTADGLLTLDPTIKHSHAFGVVLVKTGGRVGTWARINEFGEDYGEFNAGDLFPWNRIELREIDDQQMVFIPKFYTKTAQIASGKYAGKTAYFISERMDEGFHCPPSFMLNGEEVSDGIAISVDMVTKGNSNTPESIGGTKYWTSVTYANTSTYAKNRGAGWDVYNIYDHNLICRLMLIEYGTTDISTILIKKAHGRGAAWRGLKNLWGSEGNIVPALYGINTLTGKNTAGKSANTIHLLSSNMDGTMVDTNIVPAGSNYPVELLTGSGTGYDFGDLFLAATVTSTEGNGTLGGSLQHLATGKAGFALGHGCSTSHLGPFVLQYWNGSASNKISFRIRKAI